MPLPTAIAEQLKTIHAQNQKVVLVTGVFDILHPEHEAFLRAARELGDFLLVAIESDVRVKQIKGPDRPINAQALRMLNLEKLKIANAVYILPEHFSTPSDHEQFIAEVRPAFLAVSEHTAHLDKKAAILAKVGGKVIVVRKHNPAISTTQIIEQQAGK